MPVTVVGACSVTVVGAFVVGAFVVGAFVVGAFVVGAFVVGAFVVGAFVVGAFVVGQRPETVVKANVPGIVVVGTRFSEGKVNL